MKFPITELYIFDTKMIMNFGPNTVMVDMVGYNQAPLEFV